MRGEPKSPKKKISNLRFKPWKNEGYTGEDLQQFSQPKLVN